jgi:3-hydroxyacyl-[acyl-carrier-protein] dehydratase
VSETLDRAGIERLIPHRAPFLFLDRVLERSSEVLVAEWDVPADADWFRGHYPGQPVLPGVLVSEHSFQAAAVLIAGVRGPTTAEDGIPVLTRIEAARFRRMVEPGETLTTRVEVVEVVGPAWVMSARVACGDDVVARLRFILAATGALARSMAGGEPTEAS